MGVRWGSVLIGALIGAAVAFTMKGGLGGGNGANKGQVAPTDQMKKAGWSNAQ